MVFTCKGPVKPAALKSATFIRFLVRGTEAGMTPSLAHTSSPAENSAPFPEPRPLPSQRCALSGLFPGSANQRIAPHAVPGHGGSCGPRECTRGHSRQLLRLCELECRVFPVGPGPQRSGGSGGCRCQAVTGKCGQPQGSVSKEWRRKRWLSVPVIEPCMKIGPRSEPGLSPLLCGSSLIVSGNFLMGAFTQIRGSEDRNSSDSKDSQPLKEHTHARTRSLTIPHARSHTRAHSEGAAGRSPALGHRSCGFSTKTKSCDSSDEENDKFRRHLEVERAGPDDG